MSTDTKESDELKQAKIITCAPIEELVEMARTAKEPEFLKEKFKDVVPYHEYECDGPEILSTKRYIPSYDPKWN